MVCGDFFAQWDGMDNKPLDCIFSPCHSQEFHPQKHFYYGSFPYCLQGVLYVARNYEGEAHIKAPPLRDFGFNTEVFPRKNGVDSLIPALPLSSLVLAPSSPHKSDLGLAQTKLEGI